MGLFLVFRGCEGNKRAALRKMKKIETVVSGVYLVLKSPLAFECYDQHYDLALHAHFIVFVTLLLAAAKA